MEIIYIEMLQNTVKLKKSNSFELKPSPAKHGSLFLCLLDVLNLMTLFIATTMFFSVYYDHNNYKKDVSTKLCKILQAILNTSAKY